MRWNKKNGPPDFSAGNNAADNANHRSHAPSDSPFARACQEKPRRELTLRLEAKPAR
jgi:hypothetical protein